MTFILEMCSLPRLLKAFWSTYVRYHTFYPLILFILLTSQYLSSLQRYRSVCCCAAILARERRAWPRRSTHALADWECLRCGRVCSYSCLEPAHAREPSLPTLWPKVWAYGMVTVIQVRVHICKNSYRVALIALIEKWHYCQWEFYSLHQAKRAMAV